MKNNQLKFGLKLIALAVALTTSSLANAGAGIGLSDLSSSLSRNLSVTSQMDGLSSLVLNGPHHRILGDIAMPVDDQNCGWATADIGRVHRSVNGYASSAEIGICHDFSNNNLRAGLGVGVSHSSLDLVNNGNSRLNGQYGIAEVDWLISDETPITLSLLGMHGQWDADFKRGYNVAGTDRSYGSTEVTNTTLRARVDWEDAFSLLGVKFNPSAAYTVSRNKVDAYQEKGGTAPASFDKQTHTSQEVRLGLTGKYALNKAATLLGYAEAVHRFDNHGSSVNGVLGGIDFNLSGNAIRNDWVRLGAEIDYSIDERNTINASGFIATAGQGSDVSAAASWKFLF